MDFYAGNRADCYISDCHVVGMANELAAYMGGLSKRLAAILAASGVDTYRFCPSVGKGDF